MKGDSRKLYALGILLIAAFFISGCVTQTGSRFSEITDKKSAVDKYTDLGLRYIQQGAPSKARRPLKRALELDPQSPDARNALAILFQVENEFELAEEYFLSALGFAPDRTKIRNNYAAFLFEQQRYSEACEQLEITSKDALYERRSAVYENMGVCFLKVGRQDQALAAFDRAIIINDAQPRALIEATAIYYERGDILTSSRYHKLYQQLVRLRQAPSSPRSLLLGVRLARANGEDDREASYLLMLRSMFPQSEEYRAVSESSRP